MSCSEYLLDRQTIINLLTKANQMRFSKEIQDELNKFDHTRWFGRVFVMMHLKLLKEMGFTGEDLYRALEEVHTARVRFREDEEMNRFFETLIHVQCDFTGDGPIKVGDPVVSVPLHRLDTSVFPLEDYIQISKTRPVVIFSGSWT
eukprot:TRINITY_DN23722_c0_g1_i1.p1 TRINITY_DN23722_c0_g1~~TRINITY_DN23722_c0_g1_i1.p1  ORF type:complete len:146 (-),score=19.20 TRINITY_DN23722_c0_g1_i1:448-885(-)